MRKKKTSCVNIFSSLMNMLAVTLQTNDADACLMTMCLRKNMKTLYDGLCFKMWNIEKFFLKEFNTLLTAPRVTSVWAATQIQRGVWGTQKCRCCEHLGVLGRVGGGICACTRQHGVRWGSGSAVKRNFCPSYCVSLGGKVSKPVTMPPRQLPRKTTTSPLSIMTAAATPLTPHQRQARWLLLMKHTPRLRTTLRDGARFHAQRGGLRRRRVRRAAVCGDAPAAGSPLSLRAGELPRLCSCPCRCSRSQHRRAARR